MKQRCINPNHPKFKYYGGRGIEVCERWLEENGYNNFLKDMGERPDNFTLDRIDNNGNYEPSNCRWVPMSIQSLNKRPTINSKSGVKGVLWDKQKHKWYVQITTQGKKRKLGYHDTMDRAIEVRREAELKYHHILYEPFLV